MFIKIGCSVFSPLQNQSSWQHPSEETEQPSSKKNPDAFHSEKSAEMKPSQHISSCNTLSHLHVAELYLWGFTFPLINDSFWQSPAVEYQSCHGKTSHIQNTKVSRVENKRRLYLPNYHKHQRHLCMSMNIYHRLQK